jgi:CubicO group peptidase (beta-lactamase class C family)
MKSLSILLTILCILTCKVNANIFDSFSQFNDQTPGCAVGVVNNDKLVYEHYVGQANLRYQVPINNKTVFNLGSITKHFTAALTLQLQKEGRLSLNDPLKKYYPEGPHWFDDIKLHHLINHQSGLPDYLNDIKTRTVLVNKLSKTPNLLEKLVVGKPITRDVAVKHVIEVMSELPSTLFTPGNDTSYSNTGYLLLADIIEKTSNMPLIQLANERIFKPLGMKSTQLMNMESIEIPWSATGYDVINDSINKYRRNSTNIITQGEGGLLTTLADFSKWISHLIQPKENKLFWNAFLAQNRVSTKQNKLWGSFIETLKPNTPLAVPSSIGGYSYNNGLSNRMIENKAIFFHSGLSIDSMASHFWVSPEHEVGYVQLCNLNFRDKPKIEEIIEAYGY